MAIAKRQTPAKRQTTAALEQLALAQQQRAQATVLSRRNDPIGAHQARKDAAALEASAQAALTPLENVPLRRGGEVVLPAHCYSEEGDQNVALFLYDTLETPDLIAAQASLQRQRLLLDLGCVELAQDVAATLQPRNSVERMLAGHLAAVHHSALTLLTKSLAQADPIEACRLANTAARLLSVFQEGVLTVQKLRTGGKQVVTVQHVYVSEGGQAVVMSPVTTGGPGAPGGPLSHGGITSCTPHGPALGQPHAVERKPARERRAKGQRSVANGVAACTGDGASDHPEAARTP